MVQEIATDERRYAGQSTPICEICVHLWRMSWLHVVFNWAGQ